MARLLFWMLLGFGIAVLLQASKRRDRLRQEQRGQAGRTLPPSEAMVRCAQCGLALPQSEALAAGPDWYCCDAHRRDGPRR